MSDIVRGYEMMLPGPDAKAGIRLIAFYEQMKALESDPDRAGKQAACIVMANSDLEVIWADFFHANLVKIYPEFTRKKKS